MLRKKIIVVTAIAIALVALVFILRGISHPKEAPRETITVDVEDVFKAYYENEASADVEYKDKSLVVGAVVSSISASYVGDEYMINAIGVRTYLASLQYSSIKARVNLIAYVKDGDLTQLKSGDSLLITGDFDGASSVSGYYGSFTMTLKNCTFMKVGDDQ